MMPAMASRPPDLIKLSGSSSAGSMANRSPKPEARIGSARSAARAAAFWPAASPSKHSTGSGTIRHSSLIWSSVRAVPRGATVFSNPAWLRAMTSV